MKIDTVEIDKSLLAQMIQSGYGIRIVDIAFLPKGEDAYVYDAQDLTGKRYFVRLQPTPAANSLERACAITRRIRDECGLSQVVAPCQTRQGTFTLPFGRFILVVFPFVPGETLYQQGATEADLMATATLLASLHQCSVPVNGFALHCESFANPFKAPILQALAMAEATVNNRTNYQRQVCTLLRRERADLLSTLRRMEQFQNQAQRSVSEWVLTHGDPNLDNLIKVQEGELRLTDWGDIALGPPERDLFAFTGKGFDAFLRQYASIRQGIMLYAEIFAFYFYRWSMQEIADYSGHILLESLGPLEDEHAWVELQKYLPVRHKEIEADLDALRDILGRVV
jgi:Ser/Thr protein kinase RdoA (MazF antagonist)